MKLLTSAGQIDAKFQQLLVRCERISFAVAWASTGFKSFDLLAASSQKIARGIVGTHFHQTDPKFIRLLRDHENVRFALQVGEIFHPKSFLFEGPGAHWACMVGSANFTQGGFQRNHEMAVLVDERDDPDGAIRQDCLKAFAAYWGAAETVSAAFVDSYEELWKRRKQELDRVSGRYGGASVASSWRYELDPVLSLSWKQYVAKVKDDKHQSFDGRAKVLATARSLFEEYETFEAIPPIARKGIAGFRVEPGLDWKWFGSMVGAGYYKQLVNERPGGFSKALDAIPSDGPVMRQHYMQFVEEFTKAFGDTGGHGIATASRLLAMKRPDYFVCCDGANMTQLCKAFGISRLGSEYGKYWDEIIERVTDATWWNAPRPRTVDERKIWDGRAAFLDSLFYSPAGG